MLLKNKVALVTGASRGIGAAIAKEYAKQGAFVIINYLRNTKKADAVVSEIISDGGQAIAIACDVRDEKQVNNMLYDIFENFSTIDIIVNNALSQYRFDPKHRKMFDQLQWVDYQNQMEGSVKAVLNVTQGALSKLKTNNSSRIINMTSNLVRSPSIPYHDYIAGKSALLGLTRTMASELGAFGIRVNAIAPGLTYPTDASQYTHRDIREALIAQTPTKRLTTPGDVAGSAVFLASNLSNNMTGQCLFVDGGLTML
ncbi:SDR family oxidoreductase [Leuconostoc mesenteroides]